MHALTYEWRRLAGTRSTWLISCAVLAVQGALAAVTVRHAVVGAETPLRMLVAPVPVLPLPAAALGAGALGALAIGQEIRYPALRPLVPTRLRRLRVLLAKLVVNAFFALLLGLLTLSLGLVLLLFGPRDGRGSAIGLLHAPAWPVIAGYLVLVTAAGCTAMLAAGLCRSAAGGLLLLVTASLLQPLAGVVEDQVGPARWLPGRLGAAWLHDAAELSPALLGAALAAPALVMFVGYAALLLRRRGL